MNKNKLKSYAPEARKAFIQAVTDRAHFWGLSESGAEPMEEKGDVAIIDGRPFPRKIAAQRRGLEEHIRREGFAHVMEEVAYTWFNRFMALRYMEIHGYLEHGFRVLSNPTGSPIPEILEKAAQVDLAGLDKQKVIELKLDGTKDAELFRLLLMAQCNALHNAMPFLFEKINDATELLLPDNLLHSNSLISKLVSEIAEEDWQEVEIVGWLYQFYISEKKDQVIGQVVKSEDIPAATQLFTPNWIVKYMVQNSLGRMWLATYPNSPLRAKMEYYIEPAEQTDEVNAQLKAITPDSLDPEKLTLLDPANGSGHILVEAYDIFKEIYLERGYSSRDFPCLILEKNLYGLDIDDRAAQMAGFALLMKARKDDRRILQNGNPPKLNIMAIQGSEGLDAKKIVEYLLDKTTTAISKQDIAELVELFRHGKTFGSLIKIPESLAEKLHALSDIINTKIQSEDMFARQAAEAILPFIEQAKLLAEKYDCVVANPPYMGSSFFNEVLKKYINYNFVRSKNDVCAVFVDRFLYNLNSCGSLAFITIPSWLFISGFDEFRAYLIENHSIQSLIDIGRGLWGSDYGSCSFIVNKHKIEQTIGVYKKLFDRQSEVNSEDELRQRFFSRKPYFCSSDDFSSIPGTPFSYWASKFVRSTYLDNKALADYYKPKAGISTGSNESCIAYWHEVNFVLITFNYEITKEIKYFPHNKAGGFRRWYGLHDYVIRYSSEDIKRMESYPGFRHDNKDYYLKPSVSWGKVTIGLFSARYYPPGFVFDSAAISIFPDHKEMYLGFLNSNVFSKLLSAISRSMNFTVGDISKIPIKNDMLNDNNIVKIVDGLLKISKADSTVFETSFDFQSFHCLSSPMKTNSINDSWQKWEGHCFTQIKRMQELETENNRLFIDAYGLQDELTPDVPEDQITLARADREADMKRLISYAIGCMMGRYSLDQPGLVYANSGNIGFDSTKYQSFAADDDGIVPVMDMDWFPDDAASRFEEFLKVAWLPETLEENLKFVADSLAPKISETPRETIRRYISTQFFKDHMQTYKKRPIYWLFSSGKQRAFECLVYLHRYNEATLSRMRNEYVTPLQGKFSARADFLTHEIDAASTTSARNKLQKQLDGLKKKQAELAAFDDLLRHYADQRIQLDLDDGVKVNYGKFGNLLAEVKAITGANE